MQMDASVSVIVPCYRCARTISRTIESVAKQTLRPAEVILVDDASDDDTLQTLFRLQKSFGENWVKIIALERNGGGAAARNVAWDVAQYDYVAFLDADDIWHPEKIALQYAWLREHPDTSAIGCKYEILEPDAPLPAFQSERKCLGYPMAKNRLLLSNPFVTPAVMLKRDLPYRFEPSRRNYGEDYLLWLQLVFDGHVMVMLDAVLVYVYKAIGKTGESRHTWKMRRGDVKNYWDLWRSGRLDFLRMNVGIGYSLLKYVLLLLVGPKRHYAVKRFIEGKR